MFFHLVFEGNLYKEAFSNVKTKTIRHFAVKEATIHFYLDLIYHLA